jgi:hypothetical protein
MERVFTWAKLQSKWLIESQAEHTQRHVERTENDGRPRRAKGVPLVGSETHRQ